MIETGKKINTDFTLDIVQNGEEKNVTFSELLDRPAIVSVYMRNNTSGCDKQNKSLAEHADWFDEKGYKMYGNTYEAPSRSAYVIDTDGTVLGIIEKVNTKDHAQELKELIENL